MPDGPRSEGLALRLGAVQEAQRLGSPLVGTEHLLIATLTDPLIRRTFLSLGIALRDLQVAVTAASEGRPGSGRRRVPELTPEAALAIEQLRHEVPDFGSAQRAAPEVLSSALRALLISLADGPPDTAARTVLEELTTERGRRVLVTEVQGNVPPPLLW